MLLHLLLAVTTVGCSSSQDVSCEELESELIHCGVASPANFQQVCARDVDAASDSVGSACSAGDKADGWLGWIDDGGWCFNFNAQCRPGLVCKPTSYDESVQECMPPSATGYCDDDDDCGDDGECVDEAAVNWALQIFFGVESRPHAGTCTTIGSVGDPCITFDFECRDGLYCRPDDAGERTQSCGYADSEKFCDSDPDCGSGYICVGDLDLPDDAGDTAGHCMVAHQHLERCFNFNSECEGMICRPANLKETDQVCDYPGDTDSLCDDDEDCASNRCRWETDAQAGRCSD